MHTDLNQTLLEEYEADPRHLSFSLARYRWVAHMFHGKQSVLEVGCGEGQKSRIVRQAVGSLMALDSDPRQIERAQAQNSPRWPITYLCQSALEPYPHTYDAVYSLDLFEHIAPEQEQRLLVNLRACAPLCILGTPSLESQVYAAPESRAEHVNCLSGETLKAHLLQHWRQVFLFAGHDETITASYLPMAHYLMAICVA